MEKNKTHFSFLRLIMITILGYAIGVTITFLFPEELNNSFTQFLSTPAIIGVTMGFLLGIAFSWTKPKKAKVTFNTKGKTAEGEEVALSRDAHFVKLEDMDKNKFFITATWNELPKVNYTGIMVCQRLDNGTTKFTMKDEYHALIIGTTGSGKSQLYIHPMIRMFAHTGEKPDLVITDPKGELFINHANVLKSEGYRVITFNLRTPFTSSCWNPLEAPYLAYHRAFELNKEVKKFNQGTPNAAGYKELPNVAVYKNPWYGFEGFAYPDEEMLVSALRSKKQELITSAKEEIKEIVATLAPKTPDSKDPTWEEGSQDYFNGVILAMLEDSMNPDLGMTKEKFNLYNAYQIAMYRDVGNQPFETIKKYLLQGRDETSEVARLCAGVIDNAPNTTKSYLGTLNGKISLFSDTGISYVTSKTDINFDDFTSKPTAFFLIIPDEKKERYGLATLCISQLYKALIAKASSKPKLRLDRHCYFLLDEFANLPVIPNFESLITVGRSRWINFALVVQSYAQLDTAYSPEKAQIIKGNCNEIALIGTDDQKTLDEISKSCGERLLTTEEKNISQGKDEDSKSTSTSYQRTTVPLISPYELSQLNNGEVLVKLFKSEPIKVTCPFFGSNKTFKKDEVRPEHQIPRTFDAEKVYYDIRKRNEKVLPRSSNGFFD